jgi:hypothetical protein
LKTITKATVLIAILLLIQYATPSFVHKVNAEGDSPLNYPGNRCLNFSLTGDYVVFGSNPVFYSAALTFEAWIKPEYIIRATSNSQYGGHTAGMIATTRSATAALNPGWQVYFDYVHGTLWFAFNTAVPVGVGNCTIRDVWYNTTWYQIAVTYDPTLPIGNIKFYVNGTLDSQHDGTGTISYAQAGPFEMGLLPGNIDAGHPWSGLIDEVRLWNVSRTQAEIQSDTYGVLNSTEMANPDLVGYWRFDEGGTNMTSHDYSLYHDDASLASAPNTPEWYEPGAPILPEFSLLSVMLALIIISSTVPLLWSRLKKLDRKDIRVKGQSATH